MLDLVGRESSRMPAGAVVQLVTTNSEQWRTLCIGSSYMSSNDPRIHFGVPDGDEIEEVTITWPSGAVQTLYELEPDKSYRIHEGSVTAEVIPQPHRAPAGASTTPQPEDWPSTEETAHGS
jgi:hypothetical protein